MTGSTLNDDSALFNPNEIGANDLHGSVGSKNSSRSGRRKDTEPPQT